MSFGVQCDNNSQLCQISNIFKVSHGKNVTKELERVVRKLLDSSEIKQLLEDRDVGENCINSCVGVFRSLKLILNITYEFSKTNSAFNIELQIDIILQYIRDLVEIAILEPCFPTDFPFSIIFDIIDVIFKIVSRNPVESAVNELANFHQYNIYMLKVKHARDVSGNVKLETELGLRLRFVIVIFEAISTVCLEENHEKDVFLRLYQEKCTENDIAESVREPVLFTKLATEHSEAIAVQTLLCVIPKYVELTGSNLVLQNVWDNVSSNVSDEQNNTHFERSFLIMCCLSELYFKQNQVPDNLTYHILSDEKYWILLQNGLTHVDALIRKQALYLFKRSLDEIRLQDYVISCHKRDELNVCNFDKKLNDGVLKLRNGLKNFMISNNKIFLVHNDSKNIFWWEKSVASQLYCVYQDMVLVLESLEEKQVHIVKSVFDLVLNIAETNVVPFSNGKIINISWTVVLFQRILVHDNTAVVRWGLLHLLTFPVDVFVNKETLRAVVKLLLQALNNSALFANDADVLSDKLAEYLVSNSQSNSAQVFFTILLEEVPQITWCPESLFFLARGLATVPQCPLWHERELQLVKKLVATVIITHNTTIRAGVQCSLLTCLTKLTDTTVVRLETIADTMGSFRADESLHRGCAMWKAVANWLEFCYSKQNAEEFILKFMPNVPNKNLEMRSVARMIVLLHDAHLFGIMKCCGETPSCKIITIISAMLSSFKDFDKRLYSDCNIQDYYLTMLHYVLLESLGTTHPEQTRLLEVMLPFFTDIIAYINTRLQRLQDLAEFHSVLIYLDMFESILKAQALYKIDGAHMTAGLLNCVLELLEISPGTGTVRSVQLCSLQKYMAMKLLKLIVDYVYADSSIPRLRLFQKYFRQEINTALSKTEREGSLTRDLQTLWGRMNSEYLEAKWCLVERLKNENLFHVSSGALVVDKFIGSNELILFCIEALEIGGYNVLLPVMDVVHDLIGELNNDDVLCKVAQLAWTCTFERRKTEAFWTCIKQFVRMLFQQELLLKKNARMDQLLLEYGQKMLNANITGLSNVLMKHLQLVGVKYTLGVVCCDLLAEALLYGPVQRRDERLAAEVCALARSLGMVTSSGDCGSSASAEVRARAVQMLLTLDRTSEEHQNFAAQLFERLLHKSTTMTKKKTRYFGDSLVHRVKHRLLQALLLLEPYLSEEPCVEVARWLCSTLVHESHQPSVRYYSEWLLVRLLHRYPRLEELLWSQFDEGLEKRVGSLCSFMTVVYHNSRLIHRQLLEAWLDRAIQIFFPYCMAQHFSVRLYAQVIVQKLWHLARQHEVCSIVDKYRIIHECLLKSINNGNSVKNCAKLQEDFYFTTFDPLQHYTVQTIYHHLPRLSRVAADEWITADVFVRCGLAESQDGGKRVLLTSMDDVLSQQDVSVWGLRCAADETREASEETDGKQLNNFQKKMIPLKSLIPEDLVDESMARKVNANKGGLIVVASLIDKAPNLGGLGRTCEVFGVSEYVLGSLKYVEDKQFQSLAVTAEKWINITEVKPHLLGEYLLRMKQTGYTVLGAEQTAKSQPLDKVKFPKKSILLLGNEREGIPAELLPLVDVCIEVPQLGVIRSLNVHVTGALFIWEYAKQHSLH